MRDGFSDAGEAKRVLAPVMHAERVNGGRINASKGDMQNGALVGIFVFLCKKIGN